MEDTDWLPRCERLAEAFAGEIVTGRRQMAQPVAESRQRAHREVFRPECMVEGSLVATEFPICGREPRVEPLGPVCPVWRIRAKREYTRIEVHVPEYPGRCLLAEIRLQAAHPPADEVRCVAIGTIDVWCGRERPLSGSGEAPLEGEPFLHPGVRVDPEINIISREVL